MCEVIGRKKLHLIVYTEGRLCQEGAFLHLLKLYAKVILEELQLSSGKTFKS